MIAYLTALSFQSGVPPSLNIPGLPTDPTWRLIATYAPLLIGGWVMWLTFAVASGKVGEDQYLRHRAAISTTAGAVIMQFSWGWIAATWVTGFLLRWLFGLILRLRALPEKLSLQELKQRKVALVIIGGGAKGAYQVGVFMALWKLGIRRFVAIAGTSVGAMNGFLIANKTPAGLKEIWEKAVAGDILKKDRQHLLRLVRLIVGELLLLSPYLLTFVAIMYCRHKPLDHTAVVLAVLGNVVVFQFTIFRILEQRGRLFPLFSLTPEKGIWLGRYILVLACTAYFLAHPRIFTGREGFPVHPLLFFAEIIGAALLLLGPVILGLAMVMASLNQGLYPREKLNELIQKITNHATYPNCTGPVWATVAQYASYLNPWAVALTDAWPPGRRETGWTPRYIDLRTANVANVLRSTSAIPFAFKAERLYGQLTVDGGIVDNEPVTPAFTADPEVIIFVGANRGDYIASSMSLRWKIERTWLGSYFSSFPNDDAANAIRARLDEEYKKNPTSDFSSIVPDMPDLRKLSRIKFLSISPSWEWFFGVKRVRDHFGTLRFTEKHTRKQIFEGYKDTKAYFEAIAG